MRISRRHLLAASAAVSVVFIAERGVRFAADGARAVAGALRPPAQGTSATRCALCGSAQHTMLDPRCPIARKVI